MTVRIVIVQKYLDHPQEQFQTKDRLQTLFDNIDYVHFLLRTGQESINSRVNLDELAKDSKTNKYYDTTYSNIYIYIYNM